MAHVRKSEVADVKIDGYGNIPALLISHLATHKDYERTGVGRHMVTWVMSKARELSESAGCRLILLRSDKSAAEFYKKLHFEQVKGYNDNRNDMYLDIRRPRARSAAPGENSDAIS